MAHFALMRAKCAFSREENGCHGIGAGHSPGQRSDGVSFRYGAVSTLFRGGE